MNKFFISRLFVPILLLMFARATFASDSVSKMLSESIYLLELLIIAIVAVALIMVTVSIAKSRHKISKLATDLREEMGQERAVLQLTMNSIREKEEKITYIAHLLQEHLESNDNNDDIEPHHDKKKASSKGGYIEVVDESGSQQAESKATVADGSSQAQGVDPRTLSADGSIKQSHFGSNQYLAAVEVYQQQAHLHVQKLVKQMNQSLSNGLTDIRGEIDSVNAERVKLNDLVVAIESKIRHKDTHRINSKDRQLVQHLIEADKQLHSLAQQQQIIEQKYVQAISQDEYDIGMDSEQEQVVTVM
ncbi:MAG: hypothetical protein V3U84_10000 [Thiotrichaceae bacterium]